MCQFTLVDGFPVMLVPQPSEETFHDRFFPK
jgi:hypothetical protein